MTELDTDELQPERLDRALRDHDRRRLQSRFAGVGVDSIAGAAERCPIRVAGEIRSQHRSAPADRRYLRIEINDGSGPAVMIFTGRNRIRGLELGRAVMVEGVGRRERGRLMIWNPAYTLLGATSS